MVAHESNAGMIPEVSSKAVDLLPVVIEEFREILEAHPGIPMWVPCEEGVLVIWANGGKYEHKVYTEQEINDMNALQEVEA